MSSQNTGAQNRIAIFGPPPKAGELSTVASKTIMERFCLIASIVVWGSIADSLVFNRNNPDLNRIDTCDPICIVVLILAPTTTVILGLMLLKWPASLFGQLRQEITTMASMGCMWIIIVALINSNEIPITKTGIVFSWLAFFGCLNALLRVFHAVKEEDSLRQYNETLESYITTDGSTLSQ